MGLQDYLQVLRGMSREDYDVFKCRVLRERLVFHSLDVDEVACPIAESIIDVESCVKCSLSGVCPARS